MNKRICFFALTLFLCVSSARAQDFTQIQTSLNKMTAPQFQLLDLHSGYGSEYILQFSAGRSFHLSSAEDHFLRINPSGQIVVLRADKKSEEIRCADLESSQIIQKLVSQSRSLPFFGVCGGRVFIRNKTNGYQSRVEWGSSVLRDNFGELGERLVDAVKLFRPDRGSAAEVTGHGRAGSGAGPEGLLPAKISAQYKDAKLRPGDLGIQVAGEAEGMLNPGHWYQAKNFPDFAVSIISASMIDENLLKTHKDRVGELDSAEQSNLVYLVAWDADRFGLGWVHGTQHPGVEWSPRAEHVDRNPPQGPDGFGSLDPFVGVGAVRPDIVPKVVATFSGGFQRRHSAFKFGELSQANKGHHYGFIEDGVVLSRLQPSLATIYVDQNGKVDLRTWQAGLANENSLKFARQNGVPLIEGGTNTTSGVPGRFVNSWGAGNWSGSVDSKLRTPRAAACLVREGQKSYFIYAYFSSATPNSMARVFQAYQCDEAIHLDMNSAGQSYFSIFKQTGPLKFEIEHLVKEMAGVDSNVNGKATPRYLLKSDYRDFFYLREQ